MNKFSAKDWVALFLAMCVLGTLMGSVVFYFVNPEHDNDKIAAMITDLLKFIVGGLIGYIGGSMTSRCSECSKKVLFDDDKE